jgi:hypothetical protein
LGQGAPQRAQEVRPVAFPGVAFRAQTADLGCRPHPLLSTSERLDPAPSGGPGARCSPAVAAYGGYLLGELVRLSRILVVVAAGIVTGNDGRLYGMSDRTQQAVDLTVGSTRA